MVHLVHYDEKSGVVNHWPYVYRLDAQATCDVLPGKYKWVIQSLEDMRKAGVPILVLKELHGLASRTPLRIISRQSAEKKVFNIMARITRDEVKNLKAKAPAVAPTPEQAAAQVGDQQLTAEEIEQKRVAAEEAAKQKAESDRIKAEQKAENERKKAEQKALKLAAKEEKAKVAAERKAQREQERAARAANRSAGPVDVPRSAIIKLLKTPDQFPPFKGHRAEIVKCLKDGITVDEFAKAAKVHMGGPGDCRIYLDKGMIELIRQAAPEPVIVSAENQPSAPTTEAVAESLEPVEAQSV